MDFLGFDARTGRRK